MLASLHVRLSGLSVSDAFRTPDKYGPERPSGPVYL